MKFKMPIKNGIMALVSKSPIGLNDHVLHHGLTNLSTNGKAIKSLNIRPNWLRLHVFSGRQTRDQNLTARSP